MESLLMNLYGRSRELFSAYVLYVLLFGSGYAQCPYVKDWDRRYGGNQQDAPRRILHNEGGYLIGGRSLSGISGDKTESLIGLDHDVWMIQTDLNGNPVWTRSLRADGFQELTDYVRSSSGSYYIASSTNLSGGGDQTEPLRGLTDVWFIKLGADKSIVWDKNFGGNGSDVSVALRQVQENRLLLLSNSQSNIEYEKSEVCRGDIDGWLVMTDTNGVQVWDKTIGGGGRCLYIYGNIRRFPLLPRRKFSFQRRI